MALHCEGPFLRRQPSHVSPADMSTCSWQCIERRFTSRSAAAEMDDAEQKLAERLAANLRAQRQARGWTQAFFAERAGVTTHYVALLETSRKLPTLKTLNELAKALGVSPGALLDPTSVQGDPWIAELVQVGAVIPEGNRALVLDFLRIAPKQPKDRAAPTRRAPHRVGSRGQKRMVAKSKRKAKSSG